MLDLAIQFDKFCSVNNLEYAICGGTLIGAVRHKGFIPWDDDFDVIMPRKDFQYFLKNWVNTKDVSIISIGDKGYNKVGTPAKLFLTDTRVSEKDEFENGMPEFNNYGIFIDIFPVDVYPDTKISKLINRFWGKFLLLKKMSKFHMSEKKKNMFFKISLFAVKIFPSTLIFAIDNYLAKYIENKNYLKFKVGYGRETPIHNLWLNYEDIWPSKKEFDFECYSFKSPKNSHRYLESRFGDYMKVPNKDERLNHIIKIAEIHDLDKNI